MRILSICGSPHRGNSYSVLNSIKENYPTIDYDLLMLNEVNLGQCRGCYVCVLQGEGNCPLKDDRDMIIKEILGADGIVFASPVYVNHITALMKNFIDRLGFFAHRPCFFGKYAMVMAVCGGFGAKEANEYMNGIFSVFGFDVVSSLELKTGSGSEERKRHNHEKTINAFDTFIARIKEGQGNTPTPTPTLTQLIYFNVFKAISEMTKEVGEADYQFYKDKTDFLYDTKINFFKKMLAKRIAGKVIRKMDEE
jgi:multimeric flavodoxin WrbA